MKTGKRVSAEWDTVFKCISAEPRRQLIVSLLDTQPGQSVPLPESAAMRNVPLDPEKLRLKLYHVHLPLLEENGFITWKKDPFVASRGPQFNEVEVVFDALQSAAIKIPDSLVIGCRRLEQEQQDQIGATE